MPKNNISLHRVRIKSVPFLVHVNVCGECEMPIYLG
jgi:hypothetical protein